MLHQKSRPSESELRRLYIDERLTTRALGQQFGVSRRLISSWLYACGIPVREANNGLRNRGIDAPSAELLYHLVHVEHLSHAVIGRRYGVDASAVKYWLSKFGLPHPTPWGTRYAGNPPASVDRSTLHRLYVDECRSLREIERSLSLPSGRASRLCFSYGIPLRHDDGWTGGVRHACTDGHRVRSLYEQRVDEWLSAHRIEHEYEPKLPFDRRFKADFLARGQYIEVWGVKGSDVYTDRAKRKRSLYARHGAVLVELPDYAFAPSRRGLWQRKLASALLGSDHAGRFQLALPC